MKRTKNARQPIIEMSIFVALVFLTIGITTQGLEFEFNLDGQSRDFQFIDNRLVYIKETNLVVKEVAGGKIEEMIKLSDKFDLLHIAQGYPFAWVSGLSSSIFRYPLIGEAKKVPKKEFFMGGSSHAHHLSSSKKYLVVGYENHVKKIDLINDTIHKDGVKFKNPNSKIASIDITNDEKYTVVVSQSSSEIILVHNEAWTMVSSLVHDRDHTAKVTSFSSSSYLLYDSHAKVELCHIVDKETKKKLVRMESGRLLQSNDLPKPPVVTCHSLDIKLPGVEVNKVDTKPRISKLVNPVGTNLLILVSSNVGKLYVLDIGQHLKKTTGHSSKVPIV